MSEQKENPNKKKNAMPNTFFIDLIPIFFFGL